MHLNGRACLVCNCENTVPVDAGRLTEALGEDVGTVHSNLCRSQLSTVEAALQSDRPVLVTCTQEAPLFEEIAEEAGKADLISFVNIRENAGWSADGDKAHAKIAALIKAAAYEPEPARLKSIRSDGLCLIYGGGSQALELARLLAPKLSVTLLLSSDEEFLLPAVADVPIYRGDIVEAQGSFGAFKVKVDKYAAIRPSARGAPDFQMARDGARSECSVIFDMAGKTPLFAGHRHRDGYFRADPGDPAAVLRAAFQAADMVGEFEKPIYVAYDEETCAHSRSGIVGCSKCLDACPAGALADKGDAVSLDQGICGGCGSCHAVCPTGSMDYRYPRRADVVSRAHLLLEAYATAGGEDPVILVHDRTHGGDMISAMARHGKGLPANVLPTPLHAATAMGHVEMLALIAGGCRRIVVLTDPAREEDYSALDVECRLANAILEGLGLGNDIVGRIDEADPDAVEAVLWTLGPGISLPVARFSAAGTKRDIARLAFGRLHEASPEKPEIIALPEKAPYGRLQIDTDACTLCMACVSACPTGAMADTPGEPKLRFIESACVQCSICVRTCPEKALTPEPRLNFTTSAMQPVTLYEEEPFECIVCGKPFATRSTIERISAQLAGKHSMFASPGRAEMIKMCEDCRVEALANSSEDPLAGGERRRVRTTEDYLKAEAKGLSIDDFLIDD